MFYTEKPDIEMIGKCGDAMNSRVSLNMSGRTNIKVKIDSDDPLKCLNEFLDSYCKVKDSA